MTLAYSREPTVGTDIIVHHRGSVSPAVNHIEQYTTEMNRTGKTTTADV